MQALHAAAVVAALLAIAPPAAGASDAAANPVALVGGSPVMTVDGATSAAQTWLMFRNDAKSDARLVLGLGQFVSVNTARALHTQPSFSTSPQSMGTPYLDEPIKAGETRAVKLVVSNLSEAGELVAELLVNGARQRITATRYDVPFNVTGRFSNPERPELMLERDGTGVLVLKNDDPITYPVTWRLVVPNDGASVTGTTVLPAKSSVPVEFQPPPTWFRGKLSGLLQNEKRDAFLAIQFTPKTTAGSAADLPARTTPVQLTLGYWSSTLISLATVVVLFSVLLLGGLCSLLLGLWLPNKVLAIDLARRLDELARRTREISQLTDSGLRVAVRVERLRLAETLRALKFVNPDVAETLKPLEKQVDVLSRRIDLVRALDAVNGRLAEFRARTSGAPPTRLDEVARLLADASRTLERTDPTEAALTEAQTAVQTADARLTQVGEADPAFAKRLAERIGELRAAYATEGAIGKRAKCQEIRRQLPDVYEVLQDDRFGTETNIKPGQYHWVDLSIDKLYVLRHYILRFDDSQYDSARRTRIEAVERDLIQNLRLQDWYALDRARRLRWKVEEDIFQDDIAKALKEGQFELQVAPLTVYANDPVVLSVVFTDPRLNHCTARRDFKCLWQFAPNVGREEGWQIRHYFRSKAEATVTVHLESRTGEQLASEQEKLAFLERPKDKLSKRSAVEMWRLAVALGIALIALIAGAREQLLKLDPVFGLIAVFLIGFGADSIKHLFTKRTT